MSPVMQGICDDLQAETDALGEVVSGITEEQWRLPTPAQGWDSRETMVHLGMTDWVATVAVVDPDGFAGFTAAAARGEMDLHTAAGFDFASMSGAEIWDWLRTERAKMVAAVRPHDPKDRIPWFGPSMGALSFVTARLMETWSHGHDVADTHGRELPRTDRLRHVAHIGVSTRGWSYANRGLEVPAEPVRVELDAPSGSVWTWGPEDAADKVSGDAYEFCLAVTQRRHHIETGLSIEGSLALAWMDIAQAFAGPPTDTQHRRAA
ncbi:TIGR03084 family metal-binding protein [Candidatus Poriferisodalis sp.]|uniref:TIGR03084 family metal-binding protein n=1 Tax=Candidatus Poriferisodalis sp. TaxID=3101277 RepID=UPI003B022F9F